MKKIIREEDWPVIKEQDWFFLSNEEDWGYGMRGETWV